MTEFKEPQSSAAWESLAQDLVFRRPITILTAVFIAVCVAAFLVGTQRPMYRATAMVLIEDTVDQHPLLEQLQVPTGNSEAATAIALLTTRAVAEEVVSGLSDGSVATDQNPEFQRHLDLTTQVEDESLLPIHEWIDKFTGTSRKPLRLFAKIDERETGAPGMFRLKFLDDKRVQLSLPAGVDGFDLMDKEVEVKEWSAGSPIEYQGITFRVVPSAEVDDRTFLVRHVKRESAAEFVLSKLKAAETGKQTGVVRVQMDDSDPQRAADIANAIARNYLDLALGRSKEVASSTLGFIQDELELRQSQLEQAEREVERLQTLYPEAMDVSITSTTMIQHKYAFEQDKMRVSLKRKVHEEALALLEAGDYDAFGRLGTSLSDPVTKGYLTEISSLHADLNRTFRGDMGTRHQVLQERRATMQDRATEIDLRISGLTDVVAAMERGDTEVLSRFFLRAEPGTPKLLADGQTTALMESVSQMRTQLVKLETEFTPDHKDVRYLQVTIPKLEKEVYDHLVLRLEGLKVQRRDLDPLLEERTEQLAAYPEEEREQIEESLAELRVAATLAIEHRLEALRTEEASLTRFGEELEQELASLPQKELLLADPLRRRKSLSENVAYLMKKHAESVVAVAGTIPVADLIDKAFRPQGRLSPRVMFSIVVGAAFGLMLGLAIAAVRERLDGGIRSGPQLELATGMPILTTIEKVATDGSSPFDRPEDSVSEAFRVLRSKFHIEPGKMQVVSVMSCSPTEGATMTNTGLATAFALAGYRVCLIDADFREPTLHAEFDMPLAPGLAESLDGRKHWRQCTLPTGYPELDLLTAGDYYESPSDMLSSAKLDRTIAEMRKAYDLIVFDVPGFTQNSDAAAVAGKLDGAFVLYRDRVGPRHETVAATIHNLRRSGAKLLGVVYNKGTARGMKRPKANRQKRVAA